MEALIKVGECTYTISRYVLQIDAASNTSANVKLVLHEFHNLLSKWVLPSSFSVAFLHHFRLRSLHFAVFVHMSLFQWLRVLTNFSSIARK